MDSKYRICGVILSAGASSRMGRDKALLPWPPASPDSAVSTQTLLSSAIAALKPFAEAIIVVAGNNADNIAPVVIGNGALLARNPAPERGQFSSLQVGLREVLARGCDAAMITLVDCPPLSAPSMEELNVAFDQALALGKWGVAPEHKGKRGHPLLAGRPLIDAFLAAPITGNAREVKHAHAQLIESVLVPDALLRVDLNTPEEYAALSAPISKPR
ncbi:MAG TPA: nucleotidyltransferase family protein [Terracidiphilus sp.]|jgi:molybdenum cofactor cytidylyltransferase|nr:nucleotidyltransferase family protein [Terracidiphilus sp.]